MNLTIVTLRTGGGGTCEAFSGTLYTSASGLAENGSISLNVVNLQFVLSLDPTSDLGRFSANNTGWRSGWSNK